MSYFDVVFEFYKLYPKEDHVLDYAIARLRPPKKDKHGLKIDFLNWSLVQHFLFQCIMVESGCFLKALELLIEYHSLGYRIDLGLFEEILNSQIINLAPSECGSEVAWAVWAMLFFGVSISDKATIALAKMRDPIVALLVLDAQSRNLIKGVLDTTQWQSHMTEQDLYGPYWLLAYEANVKGWLQNLDNTRDFVDSDPNFSFLKESGVEFYDPTKTLVKVESGTKMDDKIIAPLRKIDSYP